MVYLPMHACVGVRFSYGDMFMRDSVGMGERVIHRERERERERENNTLIERIIH